ncbi:MAG TPA: phospholipase D-like domain-containing protein [Burkholderiales bacterium]|nr:phospholipase D-like domain-containing protein [Burkholderiales bacterium]
MRFAIAIAAAACLAGCATLPEVHPWVRPQAEGTTATLVGARGTLPPERAQRVLERLGKGSDVLARHVAIEEAVSGAPLTLGNAASLLVDGPSFYRALFQAIADARDHVNVEFYIIEDDEVGHKFAELLLQKAAQGVAVNLMYDSVGCIDTAPAYFKRLRDGGVRVVEYNPVNPLRARSPWRLNNRNHRKAVIVDGRIAFTGGINISDVYSSGSSPSSRRAARASRDGVRASGSRGPRSVGWRDTNVRIEGPGVAQLQRIFLDTWASQKGPALPQKDWFPALARAGDHPVRIIASGPGDSGPAIYVSVLSAIAYAQASIHITMAYFVPDAQTIEALKAAAARGVDVKLLLPSYTDFWAVFHAGRAHYSELLTAGVKIYERQEALLHAKTIVIDGVWSTVGSSNLDWRSFLHNQELNAVIMGWKFGQEMEALFERDLARSVPIDRDAWERRPLSERTREWAARLWEYWL